MPAITADVVVMRGEWDDERQILLIKRSKEPHKDCWAIVGGHLDVLTDASVKACAVRELKEETHIEVEEDDLTFIGYFDKIDRDPRGRYITFLFVAECPEDAVIKADDDAHEYQWFTLNQIKDLPLAFDHAEMLDMLEEKYDAAFDLTETFKMLEWKNGENDVD
jgi:8-oxo-dGTP diphosphatase